jgi:hypothetical protein
METIQKVRRGHWRIELPGDWRYATVTQGADFDGRGLWNHGWHVALREKSSGKIVERSLCCETRQAAIAVALANLAN